MWEYAVLHEHTNTNGDDGWIIVQGEGVGTLSIKVVFESEITDGWEERADESDLMGDFEIERISSDTIQWYIIEKYWDEENPLFMPIGLISEEMMEARGDAWTQQIEQIFDAKIKEHNFSINGWTQRLFGASTVTRVLNEAGAKGWELIGNISSGRHRILRRQIM